MGQDNSGFWLGLLAAGLAAYLLKVAAEAPCPSCGSRTKRGVRQCAHCGMGIIWE